MAGWVRLMVGVLTKERLVTIIIIINQYLTVIMNLSDQTLKNLSGDNN